MICQNCHIRPAALHYTKVQNGQKTAIHLCEQCAEQNGYTSFFPSSQSSFSFHDLLAGLLHGEQSMFEKQEDGYSDTQVLRCPTCNMTYQHFLNAGRFGCPSCFTTFEDPLQPLLKRLHGGHTQHCGKIPQRTGGNIYLKQELDELKHKLKHCVQKEEFEEAAQVRDQIRSIENQLSDHREEE